MDKKKKIILISAGIAFIIILLLIFLIVKINNVYYDVKFETDGGTIVDSQKVKKDDKVKKPKDPEKEGYIFSYWQLDGEVYDFNEEVNKNMVLKAKWLKEDAETITISFDTDGGSAISDIVIEKNTKITKPLDPKKEGYIFKGWLVDGKPYDFEGEVNSDITLVASWEKEVENTTSTTKKKSTTKNTTKTSVKTTTKTPTTVTPTTKPTTTKPTTTKPTTTQAQYSYKWVDVAGSTIGQADLYIINKNTGSIVSGTVTITYKNGASETVSIPTSGKRFVKSAISSVSNAKGN